MADQESETNVPLPADSVRQPTSSPPSNGQKPGGAETSNQKKGKKVSRRKAVMQWLQSRSRKFFGAAALAVAGAAGLSVWAAVSHAAKTVDHVIAGSHAAPPSVPLGVTVDVSYTDSTAIALKAPVRQGLAYAEVLAGFGDDTGPGWGTFLAQNYGAPVGELHLDMYLTGQAKKTIRVTDVSVQRVGTPAAPLAGTLVPIDHQGGRAAYEFSVNMDSPDPVLKRLPDGQTFPDFNISLLPGAQDTVSIDFDAARYSSRWLLDITYLVGTTRHVLQVRAPNGQPFAVTATAKAYQVRYISNFPYTGYHLAG